MTCEDIGGKRCFIYEDQAADTILIQAVDEHDRDGLDDEMDKLRELAKGARFSLFAFLVENWNEELSPWRAQAPFGSSDFGGGAGETLGYITDQLLPEARKRLLSGAEAKVLIGGYSLSGLFALWSAYQTDIFCGVAAASPSVWFPDWERYIRERDIKSRAVYLSLGDREERTKNRVMARVGENIRLTADILSKSSVCERSVLEWNKGNHFQDMPERCAKAFAWLMN